MIAKETEVNSHKSTYFDDLGTSPKKLDKLHPFKK